MKPFGSLIFEIKKNKNPRLLTKSNNHPPPY
jgi:hypothetical protein